MNLLARLLIRLALRARLALPIALLALAAIGFACGGPGGPPGAVHVLKVKGTVNPVMSRYIDRGIDHAVGEEANAVVIQLDTPGGLSSSMNDIVKDILNADVPVIVYVSPQGAKAASARGEDVEGSATSSSLTAWSRKKKSRAGRLQSLGRRSEPPLAPASFYSGGPLVAVGQTNGD